MDITDIHFTCSMRIALAGIDGFARKCLTLCLACSLLLLTSSLCKVNIGLDSWTATQLSYAYTVANQVGFKLFISFDFAASPGFSDYVNQIVPILNACEYI